MNKPNTFIIGAPKCGTSALYTYLRAHPQVYMPMVKEPHFFCTDFPGLRRFPSESEYLSLFKDATPQHQIVGEATSRYLYSADAIAGIQQFAPTAKLVAMLRNPIELVHSLHGQLLYQYTEDEADFELAWNLQEERRRGYRIPSGCPCVDELFYGNVALLGRQIQKLFGNVPSERRHVILYDDFKTNPQQAYRETLRFLGLPDDNRKDFQTVNPHKKYRSQLLAQFVVDPPYPLSSVKAGLKQTFGWKETPFGRWLYGKMTVPTQRPPMHPRMREKLAEYFSSDIELLADLLDRDLSHWSRPQPTTQTAA